MALTPVTSRATAHLQYVAFDAKNPEHIAAFKSLTKNGRQHPTLRFKLEAPFLDVRSLMIDKVLNAYMDQIEAQVAA